jgi:hypothetical protein
MALPEEIFIRRQRIIYQKKRRGKGDKESLSETTLINPAPLPGTTLSVAVL